MTKEQKEAIDIIDKMIKSYIEADECGLSNNDFKYEIRALQTVLNLIKEQQKEIEKKDKIIDKMTGYIDFVDEHIQKVLKQDDVAYYGSKYCIRKYFEDKAKTEQ